MAQAVAFGEETKMYEFMLRAVRDGESAWRQPKELPAQVARAVDWVCLAQPGEIVALREAKTKEIEACERSVHGNFVSWHVPCQERGAALRAVGSSDR